MAQTSSQRTKMSPRLQRRQQVLLSKACKGGGSGATSPWGMAATEVGVGIQGAFTGSGEGECRVCKGEQFKWEKTGAWQRGNAGNGDDPRAGVGCYQVL